MPLLLRGVASSSSAARLLRRGRYLAAGLCLLLAGLAMLGNARPRPAPPPFRAHPVLVAARDLPAGHLLARADLTVRSWPQVLPADAVLAALPAAVGERLASPLRRGEPVTTTRLMSGDLTAGLPAGTVAVSLPLAAGSATGLVRAGDEVDLVALTLAGAVAPDPLVAAAASSAATAPGADVVAHRVTVLAVLPDTAGAGVRLIVATPRPLAVRLAGLTATREFTVVVDSS